MVPTRRAGQCDAMPKPLLGYTALRRGRRSLAGQHYLVTFVTHRRQHLFADVDMAMIASRAIEDPRLWTSSKLLAWVLMPDHWHGIVIVGSDDTLSTTIQRLKTNTARSVRLAYPDVGQIWALEYHDHALRANETPVEVARYIVRNPVEAGLVKRFGDYPYWNASWL